MRHPLVFYALFLASISNLHSSDLEIQAKRLTGKPILSVENVGDEAYNRHREVQSDPYISIAGPSLIRVPEWIENPLGKYYLYFSHHEGEHIRMAYTDELTGPWTIHQPGKGVFQLDQVKTFASDHVASPDVHVDHRNRRFILYYHAPHIDEPSFGQRTWAATSNDGLSFQPNSSEVLGKMYMRVFRYRGYYYGIPRRGPMVRSLDGLSNFETGPELFHYEDRHFALKLHNNRLFVFYSHELDEPEYIKAVEMDISDPNWSNWSLKPNPTPVIHPEKPYESNPKTILLDPYVYSENGEHFLFYSVAKERGIALAQILVPLWKPLNVTDIYTRSFQPYGISRTGASAGSPAFLDTSTSFRETPPILKNATWIETANADQRSSGTSNDFLSFTTDREVTVYIAHDDRFSKRPQWLANWKKTKHSVSLSTEDKNSHSASIYSKRFPEGHIELGGNSPIDENAAQGERLMYLVAIQADD